jgi:sugar/nucleoside kinase (ribokinase family)
MDQCRDRTTDLFWVQKWSEFKDVMKIIDIVSPNHEEAAAVLGTTMRDLVEKLGSEEGALEYLADEFVQASIGKDQQGCVAIRAGKRGSVVARISTPRWRVPAYWQIDHTGQEASHVKDVTGAGNAFCGGFCVSVCPFDLGP